MNIQGCELLTIKVRQYKYNCRNGLYFSKSSSYIQFFRFFEVTFLQSLAMTLMQNIAHGITSIITFHNNIRGIRLYNYIQNSGISIIHSDSYSHKQPRKNPSNIDIFLGKNLPYASTCHTVNDLTSNHLPFILEFENTNINKKANMMIKTDWDKYLNKTDTWKIRHTFNLDREIDSCIKDLQKFLHKVFKDSSTRYFYNKYNFTADPDIDSRFRQVN